MARSSSSNLLVKAWRISTRLSKSTTWAKSCGRILLAKPIAAACAFSIRCSMLALESINSDNAMGRLLRLKYDNSCLAPSSNTEN